MVVDAGACVVGVDGAESRWVAVSLRGGRVERVLLVEKLATLPEAFPDAAYFAVDVPMRLWRDRYREVDAELRKRLPGRGSTVFDAPPLDALAREGYAEAKAWAQRFATKGFSVQSWGLRDKIIEASAFVERVGERALEVHPEASFAQMNGGPPLREAKRTWNGAAKRHALLTAVGIALPDALEGGAGEAAVDDVLDATAAAWTAQRRLRGEAEAVRVSGEPAVVWV